ncbi:MAG TPA: YraN family protein [Pseudomonadales bacterium]|nr:YraN family protein [Pseudomonadales bacterium]
MARSWPSLPWRRSSPGTAELGQRAERAAERYLQRRGLRTLTRNYRTRTGEIDLVMLDGDEIAFVEVRYRSRDTFGAGSDTVDHRKQHRLVLAARHFLSHSHSNNLPCRFDVVSVAKTNYRLRFEWIRNAFVP